MHKFKLNDIVVTSEEHSLPNTKAKIKGLSNDDGYPIYIIEPMGKIIPSESCPWECIVSRESELKFFSKRKENKCNSCLHTCPYKVEINNDYETLCDCDENQQHECSQDV